MSRPRSILLAVICLLMGGVSLVASQMRPATALPAPQERLVPTVSQGGLSGAVPTPADAPPTAAGEAVEGRTPAPESFHEDRWRFGVGLGTPLGPVDLYDVGRLGAGWYFDWTTNLDPRRPADLEYVQLVWLSKNDYWPELAVIQTIARANPGSLWLIGNEPDVIWQGNVLPEEYARSYQSIYSALKEADPTCLVAIGGISQPTPLRFHYLDLVLEAYRGLFGVDMPVDVWNTHAFILREEKDSWGVDIPPGMSETSGMLFEIEDHDSLEIFQQQIVAFRQWMKEHGQQDKPLIVSEYGILMPEEFGFDHERVRDFMFASFDFFLSARDDRLGYAADDHRLVQRWCWFSLSDRKYPTGNLFDPDTRQITPLGLDYASYLSELD